MLTLIAEKSVPYFRINGRSPHNIGQPPADDDLSSLAATIDAIGPIKPLAVHGDDGATGVHEVVDPGEPADGGLHRAVGAQHQGGT